RTRSVPPCQPTISSRRARVSTRTETTAPSGLVVFLIRVGALLVQETLIHLDGRAERFRHLMALTLERRHLGLYGCRLRARPLQHLLGLQLGLAHHEAGFLARPLLHLLDDLVRRHERLLQDALAILDALRALFQDLELLLEQGVLLEQGLVVSR